MVTLLSFLCFYSLIYFHGRGIQYIFFKKKNISLYNIPINIFYPLISLFFIGNLAVLLNFVVAIDNLVSYSIILIPLIFNSKYINFDEFKIKLNNILLFFITPLIIGITSLNTNVSYDGGLYHLNHQKWIQTEKIVIGLYNNHKRFGYSSIIEYINSLFWIDENLILIHFVNIIFVVVFFQIIYKLLFTKFFGFSLSILIYGFLDNFGFNGGKNNFIESEAVTMFDTPFAVVFIISTYLIYNYWNNERDIDKNELFFILLICIFSMQLRPLGIISSLFFLISLLRSKQTINFLKLLFKDYLFLTISLFVFILKNLFTSSCIFYPITFTCFNNLYWTGGNYSAPQAEVMLLRNFHVAIDRYNFKFWFNEWLAKDINSYIFLNALMSISVIIIFNYLFRSNSNKNKTKLLFLLLYFVVSLAIWMISSPSLRFGIGILLVFIFLISQYFSVEFQINSPKKYFLISIFYLFVVGTFPQSNNYFKLTNIDTHLELRIIKATEINYVKNSSGYGVLPARGDQCWVNKECVRNPSVLKEVKNSYIIFK